ncbi:hypothetical protein BD779DRAFT_1549119 [Infundibulicybe gibba]|nr:hypothetical protein BD779DRAFT_1549119 [Infundibulicybe gibba]
MGTAVQYFSPVSTLSYHSPSPRTRCFPHALTRQGPKSSEYTGRPVTARGPNSMLTGTRISLDERRPNSGLYLPVRQGLNRARVWPWIGIDNEHGRCHVCALPYRHFAPNAATHVDS